MRARYQRGYLRLGHRETVPDCWEFLWWDIGLIGRACAVRRSSEPFSNTRILKRLGVERRNYCNFAYSAFACFRMGTSGSASFHRAKKS